MPRGSLRHILQPGVTGHVADVLGLTTEELSARLAVGETVADMAQAQGVALDEVVGAFLLPFKDYLRALGKVPIIMLTARRDEVDRVVGLELGADDYMPSLSARGRWWPGCGPCCGVPLRTQYRSSAALDPWI